MGKVPGSYRDVPEYARHVHTCPVSGADEAGVWSWFENSEVLLSLSLSLREKRGKKFFKK